MDSELADFAASYLGEEEAVKKPDSSPSAGERKVLILRRPTITQDPPFLNPPAYGYPDGGGDQPSFVLIEPHAYFADRLNATTADCGLEGLGLRGKIKVTFCTAQPPQVSYLCVHATDYDHTVFAYPPHIVATETEGGLVLLSVVVGGRPSYASLRLKQHYFVYNASVPELKHIKQPGDDHPVNDHSFAIVSNGKPDCTFVLAAQADRFGHGNPSHLCLYQSGTNSWSKVLVNVDSVPYQLTTYKAITIKGDLGLVAWVDLSHMITFCNVLDKSPKLRFLRLPTEPQYAIGSPAVRDVSLLNGSIRFVELLHHDHGWKATIWSIKTGVFSKKAWHIHHELELDSSDIPEPSLPKLNVHEGVTAQPTLSTLDIGLPKLSLQDDCILYLLAKIDYRDKEHTAWVLAVDMKNKTVQRVAEFSPKRSIALSTGYDSSRISKYLKVGPGKGVNREMTCDPPLQEDELGPERMSF
ncbi:hypothetical protein CFC21_057046 [Triticum aestivum]|uniref:DUF1618 domain-containing protein n=3 Tax=Triticum TaxID=4564 RepID=A0A9R0WB05_TRITD|nr:uncharacterized protein LOC123091427 [Triticum aestivum]KAF7048257.1 hypothetical protein CFC21_057046 [Triticum aestivum]VAI03514.1 unnamed protein product [Triticum turgidum subsp. durum]